MDPTAQQTFYSVNTDENLPGGLIGPTAESPTAAFSLCKTREKREKLQALSAGRL